MPVTDEEKFVECWRGFGARAGFAHREVPWMWPTLRGHYGAPDRYYHGFAHIVEGLKVIRQLRRYDRPRWFEDKTTAIAIELAWFSHDLINEVGAGDNEERSAVFARQAATALGLPTAVGEEAAIAILATTHKRRHGVLLPLAAQIVSDIDLLSFAKPWEDFRGDTEKLLHEARFARMSADDFYAGNRAFRISLIALARGGIYYTDYFKKHHEANARSNIERSLGI